MKANGSDCSLEKIMGSVTGAAEPLQGANRMNTPSLEKFLADFSLVVTDMARGGDFIPSPCRTARTAPRGNGTRFSFGDIVGANPGLRRCIEAARLAAASPSPVFLYGEPATGKGDEKPLDKSAAGALYRTGNRNLQPRQGCDRKQA